MEVTVLFFGQIVDITQNASVKINDAKDTDALVKELHSLYPALSHSKYAIAVNKKMIQQNTILQHNEEVALLPPFSGG